MAFNLNRFDLTTLRLFVAAVDAGSLTAGAERLGLSLAAASKRVAELESHVGTPLLQRSKRGVVPTAAGGTLLPHAMEMVARLEQMALAMSDVRAGLGGHLRLWANTSAFGGFLPALLAAYGKSHPGVVLDLEDAISEKPCAVCCAGRPSWR
jgi:DNA-binding transcriptional LysR family regulator